MGGGKREGRGYQLALSTTSSKKTQEYKLEREVVVGTSSSFVLRDQGDWGRKGYQPHESAVMVGRGAKRAREEFDDEWGY